MNRLRVRTTVVGGAALGLIAGAALFGAVSSSSTATPAPFKPALVSVDTAPAVPAVVPAADCAAGQKLEHGVCIVHIEKVVVVPAPAPAPVSVQAEAPAAGSSQAISSAGDHATEPGDALEPSDDAAEANHDAEEAAHDAEEAAHDAAEHAAELASGGDN